MPAASMAASIFSCVSPIRSSGLRPIFWVQKVLDQAGRVAMISGVMGLTTQSIALIDKSIVTSARTIAAPGGLRWPAA